MKPPISPNPGRSDTPHEMAAKVAQSAARLKQIEECTPDEARQLREERGNPFAPEPCELDEIRDIEIPCQDSTLLARLYYPLADRGGCPALVYFHGGGCVLGSVEQYDTLCQNLAHHSGCVVMSVEYTLSPERRLQGIHSDATDCWAWLLAHHGELGIDFARCGVGGDSAGGNIALGVCLNADRRGLQMPAYQLLIYPSVDLGMNYPSVEEFATGYFLTRAGMKWFHSHSLEFPEQASDPEIAFLQNDLSRFPPAYVLTAGFDPLRDEGWALVEKFRAQGVPVEHECYTDMIHAFVSFAGGIPAGKYALETMGGRLKQVL